MQLVHRALLLALAVSVSLSSASAAQVALIYRGPGSCDEQCSASAADAARRAGLTVRYVYPSKIKRETFRDAVVWVQPGGNALEVAAHVSREQLGLIRNFVKQGGAYVGFCAGAFLADRKIDNENTIDGLGLIPGTTVDYHLGPALMLPIEWAGQTRHIYFENGSTFRYPANESVQVIAHYPDGQPATIGVRAGLGYVVVTGLHPEAPEVWKQEQQLEDPDGSDMDLAEEMFSLALGSRLNQ